jgi:hypothetical protein
MIHGLDRGFVTSSSKFSAVSVCVTDWIWWRWRAL